MVFLFVALTAQHPSRRHCNRLRIRRLCIEVARQDSLGRSARAFIGECVYSFNCTLKARLEGEYIVRWITLAIPKLLLKCSSIEIDSYPYTRSRTRRLFWLKLTAISNIKYVSPGSMSRISTTYLVHKCTISFQSGSASKKP